MNDANDSHCLKAVASWKLEERGEENARYFFETQKIAGLYSGENCFVIGRKGSGKTAIAEHILNMQDYGTFAQTLSFRNFPFNILAKFEQEGFATSSRYTNIWKYITYMTMLQTFAKNESVSPELRSLIDEEMPQNLGRATSDYIQRITDRSFGLKILSSGGNTSTKNTYLSNDTAIYERVAILENIIDEHIDDSTYFILYDDLDDDYDRESAHPDSTYAKLLGGLFRATLDIKAKFSRRAKIYPIVFLRDDIYDLLRSNNKAKLMSDIIDLRWQNSVLNDMVSYRIFKAAGINPAEMAADSAANMEKALGLLFESTRVPLSSKRRKRPLITEIERRSYGRPRDIIAYLQIAASNAVQKGEKLVSADTRKSLDRLYSEYLITDLIDELHTRIPDIEEVLAVISSSGKASLHYQDVEARLKENLNQFSEHTRALGTRGIVDLLVRSSVLGKQLPVENQQEFRYQNRFIRVSSSDKLYIHRGLHSGLMVS